MMRLFYILCFVVGTISFTSCVTVKEYQKIHLNDEDMQLGQRPIESFQTSFETYREGASGANGGKAGGGCGCN